MDDENLCKVFINATTSSLLIESKICFSGVNSNFIAVPIPKRLNLACNLHF